MILTNRSYRPEDVLKASAAGRRAPLPAWDHNRVGRWVMWALIAVFAVGALTVVVLRADPAILGLAAGILILGCLVLCAVMAALDSRQVRTTDMTIEAVDPSPLSRNRRRLHRKVEVAGAIAALVSFESHRLPDQQKRGAL